MSLSLAGASEDAWGADGKPEMTRSSGDASFDSVFPDLYRLAYRVAFRILGDRLDAEDVAQEALARTALRWSRLQNGPEGWVTRVASNLAIDRFRRRRRSQAHVTEVGPIGLADSHIGERADLVRALRRLSRRQREVVVLRYLADFSEAEVARALGCSVGSVKSHASRGLHSLRQFLEIPTDTDGDDVRAS